MLASLVEAYPIFKLLLNEVTESNQLINTFKIYLASELFLTVLAYFTHCHYVTFPFLNCVEKSTQTELLVIFPRLHADLKEGKTDTLKDFVVDMRRVPVDEPTSDLGWELLELMCSDAADGIMLQCGKKIVFFAEEASTRATDWGTIMWIANRQLKM